MIFSGSANTQLAERVVHELRMDLGRAEVSRYSDGEVQVEIHENVRGQDVFLLQSTCAPTNDNLMELLIMADAISRASAQRITAVIPYFGYARQDRRPRSARVAISAKVVADMIGSVGIDRILTVDLHADQIQVFSACRWTTCTGRRCWWTTCRRRTTKRQLSSRPTWAASCAPAQSQNRLMTWILPSSTSGDRNPTNLRS